MTEHPLSHDLTARGRHQLIAEQTAYISELETEKRAAVQRAERAEAEVERLTKVERTILNYLKASGVSEDCQDGEGNCTLGARLMVLDNSHCIEHARANHFEARYVAIVEACRMRVNVWRAICPDETTDLQFCADELAALLPPETENRDAI